MAEARSPSLPNVLMESISYLSGAQSSPQFNEGKPVVRVHGNDQLIRAGVPPATVRKLLGHRNIQSTLLYAEVDQATVKRDLLEYQRRQAILR